MKRKILIICLALMTSVGTAFAQKVKIGVLYYELDSVSQTAKVTYKNVEQMDFYNGYYYEKKRVVYGSCWDSDTTSLVIPTSIDNNGITYTVIGIDYEAFANCGKLTSIVIPNTITTIGYWAFINCISLNTVVFPTSIKSFGGSIFEGCSSLPVIDSIRYAGTYLIEVTDTTLTNYTIKENTLYIGGGAFSNCKNLTSLTLPDKVVSIESKAFSNCSNLTSIVIPDSVVSIKENTFLNCKKLHSISIGKSVVNIEKNAFSGCDSLISVTLNSDSLVNKTYSVFAGLGGSNIGAIFGQQVKEFIIGSNVKGVGEYTFSYLKNITSVTLLNGVKRIGNWAFYRCSNLKNVIFPGSLDTIGKLAFASCPLDSLYLPEGLKSIKRNAFSQCENLTKVQLPNSLTHIDTAAFYGCSKLDSVIIPNNVTSISPSVFGQCSNLKSITIPNTVDSIGDHAFAGCSKLLSFELPNKLKYIGDHAFQDCNNFTSVTIPESVETLGAGAFYNCKNLESVVLPSRLSRIEDEVFFTCRALKSIEIPNTVTSIGDSAFFRSGLDSISLPQSITTLGNHAFASCPFKTFDIPDSVLTIGDACFSYCVSLDSIVIPNKVQFIGNNAFYKCEKLSAISIPNSVVSIGEYAFAWCPTLSSVVIGSNIAEIGIYAFDHWSCCSSFASMEIVIHAEIPPVISNVHPITVDTIPIYVPCGHLEAYQMSNWNRYNIQYRPNIYEFNVSSSDSLRGYTTSGGNICSSTLAAFPNRGNYFVQWSDGVTDNPRTITLTQDTTITAIFAPQIFTIKFVDDNDTILAEQEYEYGATPVLPADPQKTGDTQYSYTFSGWSPRVVTVTKDATYKATYNATLNKYTITFMSDDSILSANLWEYGSMPVYSKGIPTKEEDDKYTYTFDKWSPEIVPVVGDATYTATYTATPKSQGIEDIYGDSVERPVKYIENGDIYILMPNGKKYSIIGELIK